MCRLILVVFLFFFWQDASSSNLSDNHVIKSNLKRHIESLTAIDPPRNYMNTGSLDSAADYINLEMRNIGYTIFEQKYTAKGNEYKNIIARIGPEGQKRIVIGAHYDVCGNQPGADDNASGVAGLIELSRILYKSKEMLNKRYEIVFYTLEEPPFFGTKYMGSYIHASSLADSNQQIELMICLEMIGYFTDEKKSQEYPLGIMKWLYPKEGNFIAVVGDFKSGRYIKKLNRIYNKETQIKSIYLLSPKWVQGISFSDHRNYWGYKYKAMMINNTAYYRDKTYHTKEDAADRLNYDKMLEVIRGISSFLLQ